MNSSSPRSSECSSRKSGTAPLSRSCVMAGILAHGGYPPTMDDVRTEPPDTVHEPRPDRRRRRAFPWWGIVPVALPWLWFGVRNADGFADLVAIALPWIAAVAFLVATLTLIFRHLVVAAAAASIVLVCLVA